MGLRCYLFTKYKRCVIDQVFYWMDITLTIVQLKQCNSDYNVRGILGSIASVYSQLMSIIGSVRLVSTICIEIYNKNGLLAKEIMQVELVI